MGGQTRDRSARPSSFGLTAFSLQPNRLITAYSLQPAGAQRRRGFTLLELLVVIVIIGVLAAAGISIYQQARTAAWKQKARDTARQIATAWNLRLIEDRTFPPAILAVSQPFRTTVDNMAILNSNAYNRIYLDQSADQRLNGMKDKWNNYFLVQLDTTYIGTVPNPIDGTAINANVVVWSLGPNPGNPSSSYCMASQ